MNEGSEAGPAGSRTLRTPAKINLGLRLTGRRNDGYHLLESVFAPVDLHDEISVAWEAGPPRIELELHEDRLNALPAALSGVAGGPENLVYRAAQAFQSATGLGGRIRLSLRKSIPAGAGLGGGSSDAAAVLRALVALAGPRAPDPIELASIALGLGADVPFFLAPAPALVSGIGEIIEPISGLPRLPLVLANPAISIATAEVYRVADAMADSLTGPEPGSTMRAISRLQSEKGNWPLALGELLVNDLEPAATRLCPPIAALIERMRGLGSLAVSMSGSGATVFGVFESAEKAEEAAQELKTSPNSEDLWVQATRVLAHSASAAS